MNALTQAAKLQQRLVSPLAPQPPALPAIRQKLIFAQQRLQDRHVPFQLAALSYLRLTCAAIQSAQRIGFSETLVSETLANQSKTPYLTLVYQLSEQSPHWWRFCQVSETGNLVSSDRQIQALLQPLNAFVAQLLEISEH
ncbi:MAG: hypothetical protein ACKO7W_15580 [Elainella sp.]